MRNERGSLPIVMIVVLSLMIAVTTLTQLLISEKSVSKNIAEIDLASFYEKDKIIELTKHLTMQTLMEQEWDGELDDEFFLKNVDLLKIESILNEKFLPYENMDVSVTLTNLFSEPLTHFCEEMFEVTPVDIEGQFLGYRCVEKDTNVEFDIVIHEDGTSEIFRLRVRSVKPQLSNHEDSIRLNLENAEVELFL